MSNKTKKRAKKNAARKAKVKVLSVTKLAADTHFVALQVKDAPGPLASTTTAIWNWLKSIW